MPARRRAGATAPQLALCLALAASLGACTPGTDPSIEVSRLDGPFAPLDVVVTGLEPGTQVTLEAEAIVHAARFGSAATFDVPAGGTLDLAADAPRSGDWSTADPMAPIWSMTTAGRWDPAAWDEPFDVELRVADGGEVLAQTTLSRPGTAPDVTVREVTDAGLVAEYAVPADLPAGEERPAVLVFGGSEGGLSSGSSTARWLAGLGYPALGISYFGSPGQPPGLEEVPVETFLDALAWLHEQPEVDRETVMAFGVSRGGEMALWLAAEHPDLVHGAIAPVGAGRFVCGYPDMTVPAWTLGGAPLSEECLSSADAVPPPETAIDVASIAGPVVLACGTQDTLWASCGFADDVQGRRAGADDATTLRVHGDGAGHFVAWAPYVPYYLGLPGEPGDGSPAANHAARVQLWGHVADVLSALRATS